MASTSCCTLPMWITLGGASFCHHLLVGSWKADTRMAAARSLRQQQSTRQEEHALRAARKGAARR